MFEVSNVKVARSLGVVVFAPFYCLLDLTGGECYGACFELAYGSVCDSVCFVCFALCCVCELFVERVCNLFGSCCCFVVEGDSVVGCLRGFFVGETTNGSPE